MFIEDENIFDIGQIHKFIESMDSEKVNKLILNYKERHILNMCDHFNQLLGKNYTQDDYIRIINYKKR